MQMGNCAYSQKSECFETSLDILPPLSQGDTREYEPTIKYTTISITLY